MDTLAPKQTSSTTRRVAPRTSKLGLTRLVTKPSSSALTQNASQPAKEISKENSRSVAQAPPSAFLRDKALLNPPAQELKRKGSGRLQLGGSVSRLSGLGNLVRRASRNLRDVTNTNHMASPVNSAFVDVGVEDVQAADGVISVEVHGQSPSHVHIKPKTETERAALEGNDPDIGEIMVVKRHKARTGLDFEWAQPQQDEAITTDVEGRGGKSKTGWWSTKGKKPDTLSKQDASLSRVVVPQRAQAPIANVEDEGQKQPLASQENKGSLVIRAIRSVRSLTHVSAPQQQTINSESGSITDAPSKPLPERKQTTKDKSKKPSLATRRPGESTSSWEVGALSSPERETRSSVLVPSAERRRLVSRRVTASAAPSEKRGSNISTVSAAHEDKAIVRPFQARRASLPIEQASEEDLSTSPPVVLISRQPPLNKRHSILSTDGMSGTDTPSSLEKQNRRSSTGSSIQWDTDAMAQLARKVREERKQLRAKRELERAQMGNPPARPREEKRDRSLARRRTPLSEVFDLSSCTEDSPAVTGSSPAPASVDPIVAATEALLRLTPSRSTVDIPQARPRNKPVSNQPRPVGIVALDGEQNDPAIYVLNAANADLQSLLGTMDLSATPDVTPVVVAALPVPNDRNARRSEHLEAPTLGARRASHPIQSTLTPMGDASSSVQPLRRASGSVITQKVTVWPPVQPIQNPTSSSQDDPILSILPTTRQRTRTSSSTSSVPPSAFNLSNLQSGTSVNEVAPSLTLKTLRATRGHVLQKAKFYGDLDREARAAMEARNRKTSCGDETNTTRLAPPVRSRPVSFSGVDTTKEQHGLKPPVDVITDIPEELHDILVQRSSSAMPELILGVTTEVKCDVPTVVNSPTEALPTPTSSATESSQEFVYTGVDAATQQWKGHVKSSSVAQSSQYSFCQEFSSYDEVSKAELNLPNPSEPTMSVINTDVFLPIKAKPAHRSEASVASVESVASYCVVTKRRELPPIPPLVMHGRQSSVESVGLSVDDTFLFASKPLLGASQPLTGVIRAGHRRTKSVMSVSSGPSRRMMNRGSNGSGDSRFSFSALGRPEVGEKMFTSDLPGIAASPLSSDRSIDFSLSEPTSPISLNFTSSESLFDPPRNRLSSASTVASVFGLDAGDKASKGNLFGAQLPMPLVSDTSILSDNESRATLECLDGERVSSKVLDQLSPCDPNKRKRLVAKRNALPSFDPPTKDEVLSSKTVIDLNVIDRMLTEEIATTDRQKPRSLGHRRAKTVLSKPLTIAVEPIHEVQEDLPALYHSPTRSRGSSSTSGAGTTSPDQCDPAVVIAEAEPETRMVLRRYYTFQREAQEELDHSRQLWEDTAFSVDELSDFQPPKQPDEMKGFLDDSRRFYVELPTELRARRRARAAPYCVPSSPTQQDTPESPVDDTFKDLSTWDHRRGRKISEGKIRTRKVSDDKVRTRKISEEKVRARKLSEKKTKKVVPRPVPSLPQRAFSPFVDAVNSQHPQSTEEGLKTEPASLDSTVNSLRRAKATGKLAAKQEPSQNVASKENVLRSKHSVEGMLESPTGSLRISRPRPRRRGTTTSPPSTIRL